MCGQLKPIGEPIEAKGSNEHPGLHRCSKVEVKSVGVATEVIVWTIKNSVVDIGTFYPTV